MNKYIVAVNFFDLEKILKVVKNIYENTTLYQALVKNDEECIEIFRNIFERNGKVFINAFDGCYSLFLSKDDEVIVLERYKL